MLPGVLREFAEIIGEKDARLLGQHYAGVVVKFPSQRSIENGMRDQKIRADYKAGLGVADLARRYGISVPRVYQILNKKV